MPIIPILVGTVVGLFLTLITAYFVFIIVVSERHDHHQPMVLQPRSIDEEADTSTQS